MCIHFFGPPGSCATRKMASKQPTQVYTPGKDVFVRKENDEIIVRLEEELTASRFLSESQLGG